MTSMRSPEKGVVHSPACDRNALFVRHQLVHPFRSIDAAAVYHSNAAEGKKTDLCVATDDPENNHSS